MPNNVKSYKKIDEKAQTAKFTVFAMNFLLGEGALKKQKNKLTNVSFGLTYIHTP